MSSDAKWILGLILPALFVLAGMIQLSSHNTDQRIGRLDQRIDRLDQRIDRLGQRIDRMDQRIDRVDVRLARIEVQLGLAFPQDAKENTGTG